MKTIVISLLFLMFFPITICSQEQDFLNINSPEYIDLQNSSERIDKVAADKREIIVYLSCSGTSDSGVIVPKNTYIVDEAGRKYFIKKANGIAIGKRKPIGKSGKLSYSLVFPPLPKGTKSFDMVQAHRRDKTYYFDIHQKGTATNFATSIDTTGINDALNKKFPDRLFKKDTVWFSGCFHGTKFFKKQKCVITFVTPMPSLNGNRYTENFDINSDGTFKAAIPVNGPTWTTMMVIVQGTPAIDKYIPVMLYPGDHLSLTIDDYGTDLEKQKWESDHDYNTAFVEMCEAFPARFPHLGERRHLDIDSLNQIIAINEKAACYLSNKYKLPKEESALILTQANLSKVCEALRTIDELTATAKSNYHKSLGGHYPTPAQFDSLQSYCKSPYYKIISMLRAENKAFLIVPSIQDLTRIFNNSTLFHYMTYDKDYFSIPKGYRYLYWNDSAIHQLRMFRNKPVGSDRLFEQWFNLMNFEQVVDSQEVSPNIEEVLKMKFETVTLPVYQEWKAELLKNYPGQQSKK